MIKNVVFDVGQVLIDFCWDKVCRDLGYSEELIEDFRVNMINSADWNAMDEGILSADDAFVIFQDRMPKYKDELQKFWDAMPDFIEEYDYSYEMIKSLKDKGYQVYLLSNYPKEMYEIHWPTFSFMPLVDGYIVSALEKMRKPDLKIYHLICERYHLKEEECLFFDDRMVNCDAAIEAGMKSKLFVGPETGEEILRMEDISH